MIIKIPERLYALLISNISNQLVDRPKKFVSIKKGSPNF